jgi:hypothetical protein
LPAWRIDVDPGAQVAPLSRALLGHYDLSGALFAYDRVPGLAATTARSGITGADWRVGLGRWEAATQLLPNLTDGTPCESIPRHARAHPGATDLDLIAARDWFTDDGTRVTLADTADDSRYALANARRTLDVARAFGATPFLSVDLTPRALSVNRTPARDDCLWSFRNRVSNARPADPRVFAAALIGALERLRLGSGGEPGRAFTHVELWNEPELPFFWDRSFEDGAGELDRFFEMAITALVALDAWRSASPAPEVRALRFGLAGFANAATAARMLERFDATPLPGGAYIPLDFVSFHAYSDDPGDIEAAITLVRRARDRTRHYRAAALVLSEWGPDLARRASDSKWSGSFLAAFHAAETVIAAARSGVTRAHRAILWDFYPDGVIALGLVGHDGSPKPVARAYGLLAHAIGDRVTLVPVGLQDLPGRPDVLATRDAAGRLRVLYVNRSSFVHRASLRIAGIESAPRKIYDLVEHDLPRAQSEPPLLVIPPRSIVVAEY